MTRTYKVLILQPEGETVRDYEATSYAEAFTMAERSMAGVADALYGIPADAYDLARAEGVAFDEADGLLVDDSWTVAALVRRMKAEIVRDMECGRVPLTVTGVADLHDHVDANEYGGLTKAVFQVWIDKEGAWIGVSAARLCLRR